MSGEHDDDASSTASAESDEESQSQSSPTELLIEDLKVKIASLEGTSTLASASGGEDNDGITTAKLRVLLASLSTKHSSIRQIQERVDAAQCDLLVMREEAEAAKDAALLLKSRSQCRNGADMGDDSAIATSDETCQQSIFQLQADNDALRKQIDAGSGWRPEQEAEKRSLLSSIVGSRNNLHGAQAKLDAMRSQVIGMEESVRQAETSRDEAIAELQAVTEKIEMLSREREVEQHKKKRLENSLGDLQSKKSIIENDLAEKNICLQKENEGLAVSERRLAENKATLEQLHRKRDALVREIKGLADKRQRQLEINDEMQNTNAEKRLVIQSKAQELQDIEKDISTMERQRELVASKTIAAEEARVRHEAEVERIKLEGDKLEAALLAARKQDESQRRQIEALERESAILQRNLHLSQKDATAYQDLIRTSEISLKALANESNGIASALCAQRELIASIERENQKYEDDAHLAQAQHAKALDQLRQEELNIAALRKKAQSANILLKRRQHAYEKVQMESHQSSTQLAEAQEELDRVRRRYHILDSHIDQIEDEIGRTNEALSAEHYLHFHADDESNRLKQDIAILHKKIASAQLRIRTNDSTMKNLNVTIDAEGGTITRLKKEYCAIMSERDVTCAHLVQRRDDLEKLKLKLQSQQSLMHHGELVFQDQEQEMAELSEEIHLLAQEKEQLLSQAQETNAVIELCTKLERELQRERAKKKALQNDLGRPINIHRWRFLEAKDPERYDLLQKVHRLQRRILDAAGEIAEKEALIQSKEAMYASAKSSQDRMPTLCSLQGQISHQKQAIKSKTDEIQKISTEITLNREKMASLQMELGDINDAYRALELDWVQSAGV